MKKQPLLTYLFLFLIFNLSAQENFSFVGNDLSINSSSKVEKTKKTEDAERVALVNKDLKTLIEFLSTELDYPELSRVYNEEGRVLIQFIFDGRIKDFKVIESMNPESEKMIELKMNGYIEEWNKTAESKIEALLVNVPINFRLGL